MEVLLAIVGVDVAVPAILPVHPVEVVVVVLLPDPLWSHLVQYILFLSANSTTFPSVYLPSPFIL